MKYIVGMSKDELYDYLRGYSSNRRGFKVLPSRLILFRHNFIPEWYFYKTYNTAVKDYIE